MEEYKISKYLMAEEVQDGIFLLYSSFSNKFMLLPHKRYALLGCGSLSDLEQTDEDLFQALIENNYIIPSEVDETEAILKTKRDSIKDSEWYNVVVNTTLDCNLDCWYCYENKIKGSRLSLEVIANICKNISAHYQQNPYKTLKISFFGGEPFMNWRGMKEIIDYADTFCKDKEVSLILDFTTNATLINESIVKYLSNFTCYFQITLDGSEKTHNEIKKSISNSHVNNYQKTLHSLRMIDSLIPRRLIAVRINFDSKTLTEIDEIIADISFIDRRNSYVIVKKVWQVGTEDVSKDSVLSVLQKLFDANFLPDYYVMPKGGVCFAQRKNQVLFNYDGGIFKCTTLCSFSEENSLGKYNSLSSMIDWDESQINSWLCDMHQKECIECKWFGCCLGPCNHQLMKHKNEFICTFDSMNLSQKEYLMYLFKYNILYNQLKNQ